MTSHECRNPDCRICFEYVGARRGACPRCGSEEVTARLEDGSCFDVYECAKRRRDRDEPEGYKKLRALAEEMRSSGGLSWAAVLANGDVALLNLSSADGEQTLGRAGVPIGGSMPLHLHVQAVENLQAQIDAHKPALDAVYAERDKLVALVAAMARRIGWRAGLGLHNPNDASWDAEWRNIVFVDLPTGQTSWHIHERELPWFAGLARYLPAWDGHTTEEKYERVLGAARELIGIPYKNPWVEPIKAAILKRLDELKVEDAGLRDFPTAEDWAELERSNAAITKDDPTGVPRAGDPRSPADGATSGFLASSSPDVAQGGAAGRHRDVAVTEIISAIEDLPGVHNADAADFRARIAWIIEGFYARRSRSSTKAERCEHYWGEHDRRCILHRAHEEKHRFEMPEEALASMLTPDDRPAYDGSASTSGTSTRFFEKRELADPTVTSEEIAQAIRGDPDRPSEAIPIDSDEDLASRLLTCIAGGSWSETSIPAVIDSIGEVRCHALEQRPDYAPVVAFAERHAAWLMDPGRLEASEHVAAVGALRAVIQFCNDATQKRSDGT